jgi:uncharacterized membrane protein
MTRRMLTALVALVGLFVALYLALYKAGIIGTLACGTGGCETVQLSRWSAFLGIPVAVWGAGYYAVVLALSLSSIQDRWIASRGLARAILILTGWGLIFSLWLTYLELFVIEAICRWCVVSAALATVLFGLALWDWNQLRRRPLEGWPRSPDVDA